MSDVSLEFDINCFNICLLKPTPGRGVEVYYVWVSGKYWGCNPRWGGTKIPTIPVEDC